VCVGENNGVYTMQSKVVPRITDKQRWMGRPSTRRLHNIVRLMKIRDLYLGYLVEWMDGVETWESRRNLAQGLNADEIRTVDNWCDMVDRFMASDYEVLTDYMRTDATFGQNYDGADLDGLCGFRALQRALSLVGAPSLVNEEDIDAYCEEALKRSKGKIDMWQTGVTFRQIQGFVRTLPSDLGAIDFGPNLYKGAGCGWQAVKSVIVEDGVYLASAKTPYVVIGHVIVVKKDGDNFIAIDGRGKAKLEKQAWIHQISYVRQFFWVPK
jgi:hypothetical protein